MNPWQELERRLLIGQRKVVPLNCIRNKMDQLIKVRASGLKELLDSRIVNWVTLSPPGHSLPNTELKYLKNS